MTDQRSAQTGKIYCTSSKQYTLWHESGQTTPEGVALSQFGFPLLYSFASSLEQVPMQNRGLHQHSSDWLCPGPIREQGVFSHLRVLLWSVASSFFFFPSCCFLWPSFWTLFPYSNYLTKPYSQVLSTALISLSQTEFEQYLVLTKNYSQSKSWGLRFILLESLGLYIWEVASQVTLGENSLLRENCSEEARWGARIYRSFTTRSK